MLFGGIGVFVSVNIEQFRMAFDLHTISACMSVTTLILTTYVATIDREGKRIDSFDI